MIKNIKSLKPKKDDTLAALQSHVERLNNPPYIPNQTPAFRPSSLGAKCLRKLYYDYNKVKPDSGINVKTAGIFELGKAIEDMIMGWFTAIGETIPYVDRDGRIPKNKEGKPNSQFPINLPSWRIKRGYIDNVAVKDGKLWLYEIKSMASYKFSNLDAPLDDHLVQVTCYYLAAMLHLADGTWGHIPDLQGIVDVAGVKVIYYCKDTSDMRVFTVDKDLLMDTVAALDLKIQQMVPYIDSYELPPKTEDKCNYCNFKNKCSNNWNVDGGIPT